MGFICHHEIEWRLVGNGMRAVIVGEFSVEDVISCQDQFHSKEELWEPGLLSDVWDSALLCVVHPCLNSPWCPKLVKVEGAWLSCKANRQMIKMRGLSRGGIEG